MRTCKSQTLLLVLLVSMTARGQELDVEREVKGLEGTWSVVKFERDSQEIPAPGMVWTIRPETILVRIDGSEGALAALVDTPYRLKLSPTLRGIDLMPAYPPNKGKTVLGIYRLEGDTLTLCLQRRAAPQRPAAFTSAPGSNAELIVLKRKRL